MEPAAPMREGGTSGLPKRSVTRCEDVPREKAESRSSSHRHIQYVQYIIEY